MTKGKDVRHVPIEEIERSRGPERGRRCGGSRRVLRCPANPSPRSPRAVRLARRRRPRVEQLPPAGRAGRRRPDLSARRAARAGAPRRRADRATSASTAPPSCARSRRSRASASGCAAFRAGAVRAVGTNTLRVAKNAPQFLEDAEEALGFPIEVIFGREEARLIYLGVSHSLPLAPHRRLVVDVGGGSTEFIDRHRLRAGADGVAARRLRELQPAVLPRRADRQVRR